MKIIIVIFSFILLSSIALGLGAPYPNPALDSMGDTTAALNQVVPGQTDGPGVQDKRWEQEEDRMELTDEEKLEAEKEKEEFEIQNEEIQDYRFDVPIKRKPLY